MSSIIEVAPELAADVFDIFKRMNVRVVGTTACEGTLGILIECECLPRAHRVECIISSEQDGDSARLVARFTPIKAH